MNKIHLIGRLTKDPELSFLPGSGTAISKYTMAVNRPRPDKSKPQEADFINCVCFSKRAETIANFVKKGHLFGCSGRLQISKYVDKDGVNRWSTDVYVEDFEFLQPKGNNNTGQSNGSQVPTANSSYSAMNFEGSIYEDEMTPIDDGDIPF